MSLLEDFRALKQDVTELAGQVERNSERSVKHDEQINGERGLSAAIEGLKEEVRGLRKAAYWLAGLIVASSIGFAFSVLTIFGS